MFYNTCLHQFIEYQIDMVYVCMRMDKSRYTHMYICIMYTVYCIVYTVYCILYILYIVYMYMYMYLYLYLSALLHPTKQEQQGSSGDL